MKIPPNKTVLFVGLLNAMPLMAKTPPTTDASVQKLADSGERDAVPAPIQDSALSQDDQEIFAGLKQRIGFFDPKIIDDFHTMIMAVGF